MNFRKLVANPILVGVFTAMLILPGTAAAEKYQEQPSMLAMGADLVVVRPVMLGVTVLGAALFAVTLPFSALGGNADHALETMVVGPAETTFVRCLGCTQPSPNTSY